ncbi:MAG: serine hydrolase [Planctomycetes bacterium]|nr:serine hydrolase [Planctomycetota bacterium]
MLRLLAVVMAVLALVPRAGAQYFPSRDAWESKAPAELGFDAALLAKAVEFGKTHETDWPADFSRQAEIFGRPLGPVPKTRAGVNGIILRHGYIAAEFGDTLAVDPSYSMAKSYLSTLLGVTLDKGMIPSIDDPVANLVKDGGYDSPHNAKVTWRHHATQTSEWEGALFGKNHVYVGKEEYGEAVMKPREIHEPGTFFEYNDVRVNRLALSLLRVWKRPLPEVLKDQIMDAIGASNTWVYHAYDNATVDVDGKNMKSVSGGTRWGGGLWMSTRDHARFGYLMLRRGEWNGRRLLSERWVREATAPQGVRKDYGFLWWLNTTDRWPGAPAGSFSAQGAGQNSIWVDPEHDLVVVWRWHAEAQPEFYRLILAAIKPGT